MELYCIYVYIHTLCIGCYYWHSYLLYLSTRMLFHQQRNAGGGEVCLHSFLSSALDEVKWPISRTGLFTPGKEPRYTPNRSLDGPLSRSGRFEENKYFLPLPWFEPRIVQLVAKSLHRLRYAGCTVPHGMSGVQDKTFIADAQWGSEKIHKNPNPGSQYRGWNSKQASPKYHSNALAFSKLIRHVLRKVDFMVEETWWSEGQGREVLRLVSLVLLSVSSGKVSKIPTSFHSATSTRHSMRSGVAQGGLVSPVLFSLYVCDRHAHTFPPRRVGSLHEWHGRHSHDPPPDAAVQLPGDISQQPQAVATGRRGRASVSTNTTVHLVKTARCNQRLRAVQLFGVSIQWDVTARYLGSNPRYTVHLVEL